MCSPLFRHIYLYLDDVVLYANSLEEHEEKFNKLMERLIAENLGHIIDKEGVRLDPKKIKAVKNFFDPKKTLKTLNNFQD